MSWQANTVREDSEALIKTQLDLNAQTAHHTTGHTILADAQHMAKPVSYVKKEPLCRLTHLPRGEYHKSARGQRHPHHIQL